MADMSDVVPVEYRNDGRSWNAPYCTVCGTRLACKTPGGYEVATTPHTWKQCQVILLKRLVEKLEQIHA